MGEAELAILKAAIEAAPAIAEWIGDLIAGGAHPDDTRRVRDILPERSASQKAADELHGER